MKTRNDAILVVGGCRSGKSRHALERADAIAKEKKAYVATCVPGDAEMKQRVDRHRRERDRTWESLEVPLVVPETIARRSAEFNVMVVDCLTLWISNLMGNGDDPHAVAARARALASAVDQAACPVILVANEVGMGIVPENALARRFRDAAGLVNQTMADICAEVVMTVAGIPVRIK